MLRATATKEPAVVIDELHPALARDIARRVCGGKPSEGLGPGLGSPAVKCRALVVVVAPVSGPPLAIPIASPPLLILPERPSAAVSPVAGIAGLSYPETLTRRHEFRDGSTSELGNHRTRLHVIGASSNLARCAVGASFDRSDAVVDTR
jgi:hypothetical protein